MAALRWSDRDDSARELAIHGNVLNGKSDIRTGKNVGYTGIS